MQKIEAIFERIASQVSDLLGKAITFAAGALLVVLGLLFLPIDIVNISISVLTLLILFALQNAQTKSDKAMHLKLDDLLIRIPEPDDAMAGIEDQPMTDVDFRKDEISKTVIEREKG